MMSLVLAPEYLPVADLARSRAVCKYWDSLIREAAHNSLMLLKQKQQQQDQVWLLCSRDDEAYELWSPEARLTLPFLPFPNEFTDHASHHGLVFGKDVDDVLWIGNPITKAWKQLPPLPEQQVQEGRSQWKCVKLVVDPSCWSYKVLIATSSFNFVCNRTFVFDSTTWTWRIWTDAPAREMQLAELDVEDERQLVARPVFHGLEVYDLSKIDKGVEWRFLIRKELQNTLLSNARDAFFYKGRWMLVVAMIGKAWEPYYGVFELVEESGKPVWKSLSRVLLEKLLGADRWWEVEFNTLLMPRGATYLLPKIHAALHGETVLIYSRGSVPPVSFDMKTQTWCLHTPASRLKNCEGMLQGETLEWTRELAFVPNWDATL